MVCIGQHTIANAEFALFAISCAVWPLPVPLAQMTPAASKSVSHMMEVLLANQHGEEVDDTKPSGWTRLANILGAT